MDGVSEDFSGLPEYKTRTERREERDDRRYDRRRSNPYRGHRTRILLVGGFVLALVFLALSLIVLYAPTPYLGTNHSALASSIGESATDGCKPNGSSWICTGGSGESAARYDVKVDWAGCWSGQLIGSAASGADRNISGCVAIIDHLKAD